MQKILEVTVTVLLCEYPVVKVEKLPDNSIGNPRKTLSFLDLRLYTDIRINCKITSQTVIYWCAYAMEEVDPFAIDDSNQYATLPDSASAYFSSLYNLIEIQGLQYTPQSEDIKIESHILRNGLHLICVNVAMLGVAGLDSTDCIYVDVMVPPIIAAFDYGVGRLVRHGDTITMNALSSSYDPDIHTLAEVQGASFDHGSSNFKFEMSCPFLVSNATDGQADLNEQVLMFTSDSSKLSSIFCHFPVHENYNRF